MGFTIPNYADAVSYGVGDQAEPDSVDFQTLGNLICGVVYDPTGYSDNGAVTAQATPSSAVNVAKYKVISNGNYLIKDVVTTGLALDAGGANPRFDLVVVTSGNALAIRKGTESSTNPVFPALTSGDVLLAAIYRPAGSGSASYATTGRIVDKRVFISSNTSWVKTTSPSTEGTNGDLWIDSSATGTGRSKAWVKADGAWQNLATYQQSATGNTADSLVLRDSSGNFSAGTITASLNGTATTATNASKVGGRVVSVGQSAPSSPTVGDIWFQVTGL